MGRCYLCALSIVWVIFVFLVIAIGLLLFSVGCDNGYFLIALIRNYEHVRFKLKLSDNR
jgi:hypothetical protein